tara:strand:+ start:1010 stop:1444 length:435 start_codon:yes stop_codon:yes gene_type:complete
MNTAQKTIAAEQATAATKNQAVVVGIIRECTVCKIYCVVSHNYKELYKSKQGKYIDWFNVQCYNSFSEETFVSIIKNGYPSNKIVMGMESGQFDEKTFKNVINMLKNLQLKYRNMGGVFDWEYLDAPPSKTDPSLWCRLIKNNI